MEKQELIVEVKPHSMENDTYSVLVRPYAFGQYRIQLTNATVNAFGAPEGHGAIVREMCTYEKDTMLGIVDSLRETETPEKFCEGLATDYNCEYEGGRIRLDNTPEDRIETMEE